MVARNLERGSGFLRPRLDTAPIPNLFLVEPPLYASAVVGLRRATGLALEPSGRLVSAMAMVLGAWGLFGLARRREGTAVAMASVATFAVFPLTIRYGRAFQPDALMLGALVAGLRCWDEFEVGNGRAWLVVGGFLLATGLATKIVAASILVPLVAAILRPRRAWKVALAAALIVPALLWYLHAVSLLAEGGGSRASSDNGAIWLRVLFSSALLRAETWTFAARVIGFRGFTPIGLGLAIWGLSRYRGGDRLWWVWGASALASLAILAGKLHHEYYWLTLAPIVAVEVGRGLVDLAGRGRRGKAVAAALGAGLIAFSGFQVRATWRTPEEWAGLPEAAEAVRTHVSPADWVVAPEALLFASDRRGCRLEYARGPAIRAAGEWGGALGTNNPLALVEFYRVRGAAFVADVGIMDPGDPVRLALHDAIRRRYNVLVDRPGVLIAALNDPKEGLHGRRRLGGDAPRPGAVEAAGAEDHHADRL